MIRAVASKNTISVLLAENIWEGKRLRVKSCNSFEIYSFSFSFISFISEDRGSTSLCKAHLGSFFNAN